MNDYVWHLWKRSPTDAGFRFLAADDLPSAGFASVYAVDKQTARTLEANGDFSGFKGIVHTPTLWIDCDTTEASDSVERRLRALGVRFEKWTTGNRGAHFGVARQAVPGPLLPLKDKAWVKANCPEADLSLYSHLHMFRCPGEKHQKTGVRKALLLTVEGAVVYLDSITPTQPTPPQQSAQSEDGSVFDDDIIMNWSTPQENGNRNKALAAVAYRMAERGEPVEVTRWWLGQVNQLFSEPKDHGEIEHVLRYAYQRQGT